MTKEQINTVISAAVSNAEEYVRENLENFSYEEYVNMGSFEAEPEEDC